MEINKIYCEPCEATLGRMVYGDFDNCVTSPPYYGLRDYGTAKWEGGDAGCDHSYFKGGRNPEKSGKQISNTGTQLSQYEKICGKCGAVRIDDQIGLEETPEAYVQKLVSVFREVRRVMSKDGTLWLNLGDSYASGKSRYSTKEQTIAGGGTNDKKLGKMQYGGKPDFYYHPTIKDKDLIGIPWMVAFALRADGWYLRQDIIWSKPNPMPESVTDRCTKAHEYIFLLTKSAKYYYDAEAIKDPYIEAIDRWGGNNKRAGIREKFDDAEKANANSLGRRGRDMRPDPNGSNKRSVWTVTTKPFSEAHFAVYPEDLITPCILTTKKDAIIYDPFGGAGTTGVVALRAGRKFIMSELNPEYVKIAEKRLQPYLHNLFTIEDDTVTKW